MMKISRPSPPFSLEALKKHKQKALQAARDAKLARKQKKRAPPTLRVPRGPIAPLAKNKTSQPCSTVSIDEVDICVFDRPFS